jgi:hypothetical protein
VPRRRQLSIRRLLHVLAASLVIEVAIDAAAGAAAEVAAPRVGDWVFIPAAVIIVGTLPLLIANVVRVVRQELATGRGP